MEIIDIKSILSIKLRQIKDPTLNAVIRNIIFTVAKDLDWNEVYNVMVKYMPELNENKI